MIAPPVSAVDCQLPDEVTFAQISDCFGHPIGLSVVTVSTLSVSFASAFGHAPRSAGFEDNHCTAFL